MVTLESNSAVRPRAQLFADLDEARIDASIEFTLDICRRHEIDPVYFYPSTTFNLPALLHVAAFVCH